MYLPGLAPALVYTTLRRPQPLELAFTSPHSTSLLPFHFAYVCRGKLLDQQACPDPPQLPSCACADILKYDDLR